ncbi:hypothetical protein AX16_008569 [Volvariella volvacea WC 439]|nr:hypothetical protein AX16_008569 [Volvariella volvacea WC 439]
MSSKMLLIFCDGTGQDGTLSVGAPGGGSRGSNVQYATNVLRLSRAVRPYTTDQRKQVVFYQSGVGSEADFLGKPVQSDPFLEALGIAVASKIRDAYVFIAQNFEEGDEICLFGGAYTVRKLSGLIDQIGLLKTENLGLFFGIWSDLVKKKTPTIPPGTRSTNIKCVGVWDTVGSVYNTIDALNIKDTSLPVTVEIALHAMSLQENRKMFLPTLWTQPHGGLKPDQVLKQIWFPGAHSDVGGGYERHELSDVALFWMAGETKDFINYDLEFLQNSGQRDPKPWGTSQPHNAYYELSFVMKGIMGHETRLENQDITASSLFHPSLGPGYAPTKLDHPKYMVTMDILKSKFGSSWTPSFSSLNAFEEKCKKEWGSSRLDLPTIEFEHIGDLFGSTVAWSTGFTPSFIPPNNALVGGHEHDGSPIYIIRADHEDGIHPGNFTKKAQAVIGYRGQEIIVNEFEVLTARDQPFTWVKASGPFSSSKLDGASPYQAGEEEDGTRLYVARASVAEAQSVHCGKIKEGSVALIPYGGKEHLIEEFEVLVYTDIGFSQL